MPTNLDVTVTLSAGSGPLQGTTTQDIGTTAGNGTVTFTDLRIDVAGNNKQLSASASGLTGASSSVFAVNHAAASALAIQQQPSSSATAGVAFAQQPVIRIEDAFGNLINDDNSTVVTSARNAGAGTLQGTLNITATAGVAAFTNLSHNVAGNITISFASGSLSSVTSSSMTVNPAAADHLVFTAQPDSATAGSVFSTQPSLISEDQFGNASIVGLPPNLDVTVTLSAGVGPLQGTTTQDIGTAAGSGTVSFTDLRIDVAGADKQLTAAASGLTSATSSTFTVNHASAAALTIQQQPSSTATAGVAFAQQPMVRIQDGFGNLVDDDNSTVITAARNSGTGTLQGTVTATASSGVATFANLAHNVAGNITITFSSGSLSSATSSSVAVSAAAADHLVFTAQPGAATAGSVFGTQPSLISEDQFGNPSAGGLPTNLTVTVALSSGTGSLQGTTTQDIGAAAGNGTVTFTNLRVDATGNKQLTASASGLTSATSSSFAVNHATPAALSIQQQPATNATAGVDFAQQPIVRIEDSFGNLISDDNSTVVTVARNAGTGPLQGTLNIPVSSGLATFTNLSHNVAGNITVLFTSGALTSVTSDSIVVSPAVADHLVFVTQPGSATAGAAFGTQPSLISEDQFGNASAIGLPPNLDVTVTLSAGAGPLQGTTTQDVGMAAGNGTVTFADLRIDVAGTDKQFSATASGLTGASSSVFAVDHAAASTLVIQQQPSSTATAGIALAQQPIVRIEDAFGNLVSDDNSSVVTASRAAGTGSLQGTVNATAVGGVASFADLSHNVAGNITIAFTSGSLSSATSSSIAVSPAAANHLVYVAQPGLATAGAIFGSQPSLITEDQFGNISALGLPANLNVTVALTSGTGPLQGTTTKDIGTLAGNGTVTFTDLRIDVAGNNKQLTASAAGLTSALSSVFSVNHGTASALAIQQQPSSTATAGVDFAQQLQPF
ncbi:MAG: beta strand repeat-containing protein, partial [Limisphaerales bacterium]